MSRISCVRSTTRAFSASSRERCCVGLSSSSTRSTSAFEPPYACLSSSSFPLPTYVRGSGRARCWTSSPIVVTPAVRASSWSSASSSSGSAPWARTATANPRSGSAPGAGSGWRGVTCRLCPALGRIRFVPADLALRTLELVNVPSETWHEGELAGLVETLVPLPLRYREDHTLLFHPDRTARPLVVLAGHLDTVPANGNLPGRLL